ncbi:MAG: ornithine cyclodeaminase family protein [Anaerolineae bacterium]|nr:ornithine cyclodeaminase family protein [Anaerolineae bacterium]
MALLLTREDIQTLLTMDEAIQAVEEGFRQHALGKVTMPLRTAITIPEHHGLDLIMPAYVGGEGGGLGLKVVSVYPDNPRQHNLPTILATVLLQDPRTGDLLAIMDGTYLTAMRTGAAGGVAARYLARPDARRAGIFGAGVQARTQLEALCRVRPIEEAWVYDPMQEHATRFAEEMSQRLGIPVHVAREPRQAVEGMDVIVTATTSRTPVFDGAWVAPGTHVTGVGSHTPDGRELDSTLIQRARVVVDERGAALSEAGDLIIPLQEGLIREDHIAAELGEVVAGLRVGRETPEQVTVFKSVGLALQDIAAATRVYQMARAKGVGMEVSL